jgi:hypothetical protein
LFKTRWTARAEFVRTVWLSFEAIVSVLHEISKNSNIDKNSRAQALDFELKRNVYQLIIEFVLYEPYNIPNKNVF